MRERPATLITLHPLVPVAAVFLLGLLAGQYSQWSIHWDFAAIVTGVLLWALLEWRSWRKCGLIALALSIAAAGSACWRLDQHYVENAHLARLVPDDQPVPVLVRATVLTDAIVQPRPPDLSPYGGAAATTRCVAQIQQVMADGRWQTAAGISQVTILDEVPLHPGDQIEITGLLSRPSRPTNPGGFDSRAYLARSGILLQLRAKSTDAVTLLSPGSGAGLLDRFQLFLRSKLLEQTVPRDEDSGKTLVALLFGWRDPAMRDITQSFTDAGAAHLLAISGMHVAVIAGAVWLGLSLFIRRPGARLAITMLIVAVYMLATPMAPPVLRAGIAVLIVGAGRLSGRRPRATNVIAATMLIVLLLRPADLVDAGFQLTFICTICLILFSRRVYQWLLARLMPAGWATGLQQGWTPRIGAWAVRFFAAALAANLIGAAASMPLVAYHFHQANPWSILTGMLLLPVISALIIAAMAQAIVSMFWGSLGGVVAMPVVWATQMTERLVAALAHLPGACPGVRPPPVWLICCCFGVALLWAIRRQIYFSRATIATLFIGLFALIASWYTLTQRHDALHIWALDMGEGNCIIIESSGGQHIIINAGSKSRSAQAEHAIEPFLRVEGINTIDAALLCEATREQGSALADLLRRYPTAHIFCSDADLRHQDYWWIHAMLGDLRLASAAPHGLAAGDRIQIGDIDCQILWPPRTGQPATHGIVMLLTCAQRRILIIGGEERPALATANLQPVDIVILSNNTPASPDLIAAVPLRPGGIWIGPTAGGIGLDAADDGCVHVTAGKQIEAASLRSTAPRDTVRP